MLEKVDPSNRNAFSVFDPATNADYAAADSIGHFYGIDLLRGLAAITVLIWHYQHFYVLDHGDLGGGGIANRSIQPLYHLLFPIYENGFWAVGGFWTISGFVFSHVYAGKVTRAANFAGARFARLYPLHFITLVTIGLLQAISANLVGHYQMVASNGLTSAVENMLFISGWELPGGQNFNGPIWSVSVELAIYAGFFFLARRIYSFGLLVPGFVVMATFMLVNDESPVWNFPLCACFFFIGVMLYYWLIRFHRNGWMIVIPSAVSAMTFAYLVGSGKSTQMRFYDVQCFLFPPIILLVGWLDLRGAITKAIRPIRFIGDTTYSTYLWHFPLQVLILIFFSYFGWGSKVFNSPVTLIVWVVGVVLLAHLSFRKIEKPLQAFVRRKLREARAVETRI
jgi:peptidoglycan/LPS O-acetylase OafA/YrhL